VLAMDQLRAKDEIGDRQVVDRPNLGLRVDVGRGQACVFYHDSLGMPGLIHPPQNDENSHS